jgi:large subunit ribosomal protein L9
MAKRVQLVLNEDVYKLGRNGDLVEVAPGYARNFLLPRGLAMPVTPGVLKQVEYRRAKEAERLAALKQEMETQKRSLETVGRFVVRKQVGENEAIFGTVTNGDVAEAILAATKLEIDRRDITVPEIHKLGSYKVQIKLHPEVEAEVEVQVAAL